MSGYSTGDQDWRRDPENQCNIVLFQSFGAFVPEQWPRKVPSLRFSHEYSACIESLTITGKECFMEKAGLQRCQVRLGHCILPLFVWQASVGMSADAGCCQCCSERNERRVQELCWLTYWRSYWHMHLQGTQFCWFCLFALSPPEGKKRRQVEELKERRSCRRCKKGERRRNGGADRRPGLLGETMGGTAWKNCPTSLHA